MSTGLLVSVRSAAEARIALAGGAGLIDVKEPSRGPLGPADPQTWAQIRRVVPQSVPTSVALGELLNDRIESLAGECGSFEYAKIGLAGCHERSGWVARWRRVVQSIPQGTHPVPVAYADWQAADAPSPRVAVAMAQGSPSRLVLIDTFDKSAGSLLGHVTRGYLAELSREAREVGVRLVLAGSLDLESIRLLLRLRPKYVGVRGAACRCGREGTIDLSLVKSLSRVVHTARRTTSI